MAISKDWLNEQINQAEIDRDNSPEGSSERSLAIGKIVAYKTCYAEQTKPPVKKDAKIKELDSKAIFKTYHSTIKFYMESPKFIEKYPDLEVRKVEANRIAQTVIKKQKQKILDAKI